MELILIPRHASNGSSSRAERSVLILLHHIYEGCLQFHLEGLCTIGQEQMLGIEQV